MVVIQSQQERLGNNESYFLDNFSYHFLLLREVLTTTTDTKLLFDE